MTAALLLVSCRPSCWPCDWMLRHYCAHPCSLLLLQLACCLLHPAVLSRIVHYHSSCSLVLESSSPVFLEPWEDLTISIYCLPMLWLCQRLKLLPCWEDFLAVFLLAESLVCTTKLLANFACNYNWSWLEVAPSWLPLANISLSSSRPDLV